MKFLFTKILLLSLLLFTNCQNNEGKNENKSEVKSEKTSVNELEKKSLAKLYEAIKAKKNEDIELKEDEIRIGKAKVKVSTAIEFDGNRQGKWIFAARFDTKLIDTTEAVFTVGSIGIGEDKNDAVETSIDEWIGLFGTAFSEMLSKSEGIKVGGFKVFSGLMGIRGEKPSQGWIDGSPKMNEKILNALLPIIKKSNKEMNSINLMLTVNENGEIDGECKMNNEVSQDILNELKKLNWEKSSTGYLFKQFYLIKKNPA
ncbi:hypothetical protein BH10ACI1_BH10ACI1_03550 [soil metagenome]